LENAVSSPSKGFINQLFSKLLKTYLDYVLIAKTDLGGSPLAKGKMSREI